MLCFRVLPRSYLLPHLRALDHREPSRCLCGASVGVGPQGNTSLPPLPLAETKTLAFKEGHLQGQQRRNSHWNLNWSLPRTILFSVKRKSREET